MSESDPVLVDASPSGVAVVLLNRPEKRNAFDARLIQKLDEAFSLLSGADHVRVVLLRGAGSFFCAGADVEWMREQGGRPQQDNQDDALALANMLYKLRTLPQLTMALVEGAAMGGGAGLVAACDVALATETARFAFSEVRLGLIPATIGPYVLEAIGPRWARALFTTGQRFDGLFAQRIGLVHDTARDVTALNKKAEALTREVFAAAPGAVADAKLLIDELAGRSLDHGLLKETAHRIAVRRSSDEAREGLAAFMEKRQAGWFKLPEGET